MDQAFSKFESDTIIKKKKHVVWSLGREKPDG